MFREPIKVPLPQQDEFYPQYRIKNTFIDTFEDDEENMPFEFGLESAPAGIWKFAKRSPAAQQQPVKVSLDPSSPVATHANAGGSVPPGFGLEPPAAAPE